MKRSQEDPKIAPVVLRFGECDLDTTARQLRRAGQVVRLHKKAYELLRLVISARPRVVAKAELMDQLWPDTFVSEANIAVQIGEVRAAIGDSAKASTLIRTHSGVGYSFIGPVTEAVRVGDLSTSGLVPVLSVGVRRIVLPEGTTTIGRDPSCDLHLVHRSVSRRHARLVIHEGSARIEDAGSKNGVTVNGRAVKAQTAVPTGASLVVGSVELSFAFEEGGAGSTWSVRD